MMKKINPYLLKGLSFILLLLTMIGCNVDELDNLQNAKAPELTPHLLINVGTLSYTMDSVLNDFVEDQENNSLALTTDSDNDFFIRYIDTILFSVTPDSTQLIEMDGVESSEEITSDELDEMSQVFSRGSTDTLVLADLDGSDPGEPDFSDPSTRSFTDSIKVFEITSEGSNERIDTLEFTAGNIEIGLSSTYDFDVSKYIITIPGLQDVGGGASYSEEITSEITTIPLVGKQLVLVQDEDTAVFVVNIALIEVAGDVKGNTDQAIIVSGKISDDNEISVIRGFFGSDDFTIDPVSTEFDVLDEFRDVEGLISFDGIQTTLEITNELGAPLQFDFAQFLATGGSDGDKNLGSALLSSNEGVTGSIALIPAAISTTESSQATFVFGDNGGDEMDEIINTLPTAFVSPSSATPNPAAVAETTHNFMNTESEMKIVSTIEIPLSFSLSRYSFDTISVDVDLGSVDSIISLGLGMNVTSTLPFNAYARIYADDDYVNMLNVSDTLFSRSEEVQEYMINISDPDRMSALLNAEKLNVVISFDTDGSEPVPISSDMGIELDLYFDGEFVIDPN